MPISKERIEELEVQLMNGIKTSDVDLLDRILHDDLRCMMPDGTIITKAMDLASHRAGNMVVEALIPEIQDISIIDDTALVTIIYKAKGKMLGTPIQGTFKYLRIWKKFDEGFKVIAVSYFQLSNSFS